MKVEILGHGLVLRDSVPQELDDFLQWCREEDKRQGSLQVQRVRA